MLTNGHKLKDWFSFVLLFPLFCRFFRWWALKFPFLRVSFPRNAITPHHKLGGFKQQKCIVLQFKRLKVQNQGVSMISCFWGLWGRNSPMPFSKSLVVSDDCWHSLACKPTALICILCHFAHLLCQCVHFFPLMSHKNPLRGFKAYPYPVFISSQSLPQLYL